MAFQCRMQNQDTFLKRGSCILEKHTASLSVSMEETPANLNQCFHLYDRVHSLSHNMIETELKKLERFDTEHTIAITVVILNVSYLFSVVSTREKEVQYNTAIIRAIHPA